MIYSSEEIRNAMNELCGGDFPNAKDGYTMSVALHAKIIDMMDDMMHALDVWSGFASYLNTHGMLPQSVEGAAAFWNRPQDKENTRVWDE